MLIFFMLAFLLSFLAILTFESESGQSLSIRKGLIKGAIGFGALLVIITEGLSLFSAVNKVSLSIVWLMITSLLSGLVVSKRKYIWLKRPGISWKSPHTLFLLLLGVVVTTVLIVGLLSPPSNWDSLTYHIARVVHWMQNEHIAHYPSHIMRQHYQPPFAEMVIMHLQILSGGDRYANLVQWGAWIGCMVGVSLITRQLGGNSFCQVASVVFVATLPMGILQASSTQNDLVVSFFVVSLVYWLLRLREKISSEGFCFAGLSLGLALLTKGTAYIFVFPWLLWFAFIVLNREGLSAKLVRSSIAMVAIALVLNAGHYHRNISVYGHPLGGTSEERAKYSNAEFSPRVFLSNVSRNLVLHLEAPPGLNNYYWQQLIRRPTLQLHRWIGLDLHDPRTTLAGELEFKQVFGNHEDYIGNFFHTILAMGCTLILIFRWHMVSALIKVYGGLVLLSFLLYCFYLRWQIWAPRLHLPFFVLLAPYCLLLLSIAGRKVIGGAMVVLFLAAVPALLFNESRPLLPASRSVSNQSRDSLLFANRPEIAHSFKGVKDYIVQKNFHKIGLQFGEDTWEYPIWSLLGVNQKSPYHIEHILVDNPSGKIVRGKLFQPDCILVDANVHGQTKQITLGKIRYRPMIITPYLTIFEQF